MSDNPGTTTRQDDGYTEFARKMQLIEYGPTTTHFQQLVERGDRASARQTIWPTRM